MYSYSLRIISEPHLVYAVMVVLNIDLVCFAIVLGLMALLDRENLSFRWFALGYVAGCAGALMGLFDGVLPLWIVIPVVWASPPAAFACYHAGFSLFLNRWTGSRWLLLALVIVGVPFYAYWSFPDHPPHGHMSTLQDGILTIQTGLSAALLLTARDRQTRWPRGVLGGFLVIYSAVELVRVAVFLVTGALPEASSPPVEFASSVVYVVCITLLPFAYIWMQNARLHAHLEMQITIDPLTHLLNRRGLSAAAHAEIVRYRRAGQEFAVVIMDVDHFKHFNDTFGHAAGDLILCEIASLLRARVRQSDSLGRFGGEEFVLLLPLTPPSGALHMVENLRAALEGQVFHLGGQQVHVHASFGVAVSRARRDISWETLLSEADLALYQAKRAGRNTVRIYDADAAGLLAAGETSMPNAV